jgi:Skp family chaperone for outer membrane proteins
MKIALIAWNVLLTAALAYLFFTSPGKNASVPRPMAANDSLPAESNSSLTIAFVNIDTLQSQYELFSQKRKQMEQKQKSSESLFARRMEEFQKEYLEAEQSAPTMTRTQLEETQLRLQQRQLELQQLQEKLQTDFQKDLTTINKELEDSLNSFIEDYNSGKQYSYILSHTSGGGILYGAPALDITGDVVTGMNARLKKE